MLNNHGSVLGTCIVKSSSPTTINVFVTPESAAANADGSYERPFGSITQALAVSNENAAPYHSAEINIYLLKGDHYMTRGSNFDVYNKDDYSQNKDVLIQPAFWGQTFGGHHFADTDTDCISSTEKTTVYYKMGNEFEFVVPKSLSIKSVIFDALDSTIDPISSCLRNKQQCCVLEDKNLNKHPLNEETTNWGIATYQIEAWVTTIGNYFFKFHYSESLSIIDSVGTLRLESWEFRNFFYDISSLIGLANGHGHTVITNSNFDKFSNWASIIGNNRELVDDLIRASSGDASLQTFRSSYLSASALKTYYVEPAFPCTDTLCASIEIVGWSFSNFNYLKSLTTQIHVTPIVKQMRYQGMILNLKDFGGSVVVKNNNFNELQFQYNNCKHT